MEPKVFPPCQLNTTQPISPISRTPKMTDTEQLSALHTAVTSYLSTLLAVSDCVGAACPEIGGPYRHRLSRLRSRLAFDANPQAMIESNATVERELAQYAKQA